MKIYAEVTETDVFIPAAEAWNDGEQSAELFRHWMGGGTLRIFPDTHIYIFITPFVALGPHFIGRQKSEIRDLARY